MSAPFLDADRVKRPACILPDNTRGIGVELVVAAVVHFRAIPLQGEHQTLLRRELAQRSVILIGVTVNVSEPPYRLDDFPHVPLSNRGIVDGDMDCFVSWWHWISGLSTLPPCRTTPRGTLQETRPCLERRADTVPSPQKIASETRVLPKVSGEDERGSVLHRALQATPGQHPQATAGVWRENEGLAGHRR